MQQLCRASALYSLFLKNPTVRNYQPRKEKNALNDFICDAIRQSVDINERFFLQELRPTFWCDAQVRI
jgi:hypothetical protein